MTISSIIKKNFFNSYRRRENIKRTCEIISVQGLFRFIQKTIRYLTTQTESEITEAIKQYSGKNKTFIDIGAGTGSVGLNAAPWFKKCVFIEPSKINFQELSARIQKKGINNIILKNVALSNKKEKRSFYLSKNSQYNHRLSISEDEDGEEFEPVEIQTDTLDNIITELNLKSPFVIKIDVEGAEPIVMKGAINILKEDCVIITEFSSWRIKTNGTDPLDFVKFMKSFEYSFFELNGKPGEKMILNLCKRAINKKRVVEDFIIKKVN